MVPTFSVLHAETSSKQKRSSGNIAIRVMILGIAGFPLKVSTNIPHSRGGEKQANR